MVCIFAPLCAAGTVLRAAAGAIPAADSPSVSCHGTILMLAIKNGRDFFHEPRHFILHLGMRLQPYIEVQDDLFETGGLDFFQGLRDARRVAQQNGVFRQILGLYLLQTLDHLDKISITWRCRFWVAGQCRDGALSVIAYLTNSLRFLLRLGVGEVREIAAHQATRRIAVADAGFMIEIGDLLQSAEAYRSSKWRDDEAASEPRSKLDRRFRERSDIGRDWPLHWFRGYPHIIEGVVHATMRYASLCCPQHAHKFQTLLKYPLIVFERNPEGRILAPIVASPRGKIDAPVAQEIKSRPLFSHANRMMQGQHRHGGRQPDVPRARCDIGQHHVWARKNAERVEVMFADPCRMHADHIGVQRLVGDVGNELV